MIISQNRQTTDRRTSEAVQYGSSFNRICTDAHITPVFSTPSSVRAILLKRACWVYVTAAIGLMPMHDEFGHGSFSKHPIVQSNLRQCLQKYSAASHFICGTGSTALFTTAYTNMVDGVDDGDSMPSPASRMAATEKNIKCTSFSTCIWIFCCLLLFVLDQTALGDFGKYFAGRPEASAVSAENRLQTILAYKGLGFQIAAATGLFIVIPIIGSSGVVELAYWLSFVLCCRRP